MSIKKSQEILKFFIDLKITLGSEDETIVSDTQLF